MNVLEEDIRNTLLYFDIWQYPLTADEIFAVLPRNSLTLAEFKRRLRDSGPGPDVAEEEGFYFLKSRSAEVVSCRREGERRARMMWRMGRVSTFVIKRFPFVRGIMVSGDLSKNLATSDSDVDFFIITSPDRLWIARALLILFKKVFLFNSKKYFCLNTFLSSDHLTLSDENIYVAAEVAYLKPMYNLRLFNEFRRANSWILDFFPNFDAGFLPSPVTMAGDRGSFLQKLLELPFELIPSDRLDTLLLSMMERVWKQRYPEIDDARRARSFRSTKTESRTYPTDYQDLVLTWYAERRKAAFASPVGGLSADEGSL